MRELIKHILREERISWTKDEVLKIAREHSKMNDFKNTQPKAYSAARRNGWLDDVRQLMTPAYEEWNDIEKIRQEASKYETLKDFRTNSPKAYAASKYKGILDDLKKTLKGTTTNEPTLSPKDVETEALKFSTRKDFRTKSPLAYRWAIKYNLFGNTITHLGNTLNRKEAGYWDYEKLKAEAFKYKSKKEFSEKNSAAVSVAKQKGIWDEITSHMETLGSLYQRAVYAWEFPDNSVYVGLTFNLELRGSQHLDPEGKTQVSKHIKQTGLIPIFVLVSDFVDQTEAQNLENCTVEDYRSKGWNILNRVKTGGLGSCRRKWTYDTLKDEASKYDNVGDFKKNSYSAYVSAQKYGFFNELTKDMKRRGK